MERSIDCSTLEDSYLDELNAAVAEEQARTASPVPDFIEFENDQLVAEACRCTVQEAQKLPSAVYARYLHFASAKNEAMPKILERQRERQERKAEEDKERRDMMNDY